MPAAAVTATAFSTAAITLTATAIALTATAFATAAIALTAYPSLRVCGDMVFGMVSQWCHLPVLRQPQQ